VSWATTTVAIVESRAMVSVDEIIGRVSHTGDARAANGDSGAALLHFLGSTAATSQ
jgi:hypothetical protein